MTIQQTSFVEVSTIVFDKVNVITSRFVNLRPRSNVGECGV